MWFYICRIYRINYLYPLLDFRNGDLILELQNLPAKIVESVYSPELSDLALDLSEVGLDTLLDAGFIKDLPAIGTIVKLFKAGGDIRDRLFLAKIAKFLFKLNEIPFEDRHVFKQKVSSDANYKKKVGQALVIILERLDDLEKPEMIGKCFSYFLLDKITFAQFRRLSSAIDLAFIDDLKGVLGLRVERIGSFKENLARTGLVKFHDSGSINGGEPFFFLSSLGNLFMDIMNDKLGEIPSF